MPRAIGQATTAATTEVLVGDAAYNEPTSGAQRSIKSSSANDAAAGTGARTVRIKYFTLASDGTIIGPFYETLTLNGTTAVATVATNIALVELIEVMSAGSGGVAAGAITLYPANDGTGTAIAVLATGDVRTRLAQHYVASGATCELTDLEVIGGNAAAALLQVKRLPYPSGIEQPITGQYGTTSTLPRGVAFTRSSAAPAAGPCRLRLTVTPANNTSQVTYASFGFVDHPNIAP